MSVRLPIYVPSEFLRYIEGVEEDAVSQARALLGSQGREVAGTAEVEVVLELGRPAECITSIARTRHAGLIVMGLASEEGATRSPWCHRVPRLVSIARPGAGRSGPGFVIIRSGRSDLLQVEVGVHGDSILHVCNAWRVSGGTLG